MTTTEMIELLQAHERGGVTRRSRELSFYIEEADGSRHFIGTPDIIHESSGDGLVTTLGLCLKLEETIEELNHESN